MHKLTDLKLIGTGTGVSQSKRKMTGRPQVAMHSNFHISNIVFNKHGVELCNNFIDC